MNPLNVFQHVATRCSSCLHQEARLRELKRAIILMIAEGGDMPRLSGAEWTIVEQCEEILRPIEQLTKKHEWPILSYPISKDDDNIEGRERERERD